MVSKRVRRPFESLSSRRWTLFAALVFAIGGMVVGGPIVAKMNLSSVLLFDVSPGRLDWVIVVLSVGLGTFTSGAVAWWALIEQSQTASPRRGVAVGIFTVVLAQVSSVLVVQLIQFFPRLFRIPGAASSVEGFLTYLIVLTISTISFTLGIALLSLVLFGVILFPVGIGIGLLLARVRRPTIGETASDRAEYDSAE